MVKTTNGRHHSIGFSHSRRVSSRMSDHGTVHAEVTAGNVSESADGNVSVNEFVESGDIDQSDEDGDNDQPEEAETKDKGENGQQENTMTLLNTGMPR